MGQRILTVVSRRVQLMLKSIYNKEDGYNGHISKFGLRFIFYNLYGQAVDPKIKWKTVQNVRTIHLFCKLLCIIIGHISDENEA